jgi:hypothetical protein
MRHVFFSLSAALGLALASGAAQARPFDAKALARYDHSYVACEAGNPEMKGHRDEAYLNLWRIPVDAKSQARLAKLRADPVYAAETKRVAKTPSAASAPASSVVQRQCQGLWAEHQRVVSQERR